MKFTINDLRSLGFCCTGIKTWFDINNLDFRMFLNEGLEFSKIEHINCLYVIKLKVYLGEV